MVAILSVAMLAMKQVKAVFYNVSSLLLGPVAGPVLSNRLVLALSQQLLIRWLFQAG